MLKILHAIPSACSKQTEKHQGNCASWSTCSRSHAMAVWPDHPAGPENGICGPGMMGNDTKVSMIKHRPKWPE